MEELVSTDICHATVLKQHYNVISISVFKVMESLSTFSRSLIPLAVQLKLLL